MRLLHKNQKGFTLIELLITVAIVAGIAVVANAAIVQLVQSNRTSNHMVAVRQVQQAGYRVNHDGVQAQNIDPGEDEDGGFPLTLSWNLTDLVEGGELHTVVYNLTNPSGGVYQLQRQETVDGAEMPSTIVAQYMEPPGSTECSWNATEWVLTLNITARVGLQTESRTYEIKPRPSV